MEKNTIKTLRHYRNNFGQLVTREEERDYYKVTREEFNQLLKDKKYLLVSIKLNEKSNFLLENQPEYLTNNAKWAILNFAHGLESIYFAEFLSNNDEGLDRLEVI